MKTAAIALLALGFQGQNDATTQVDPNMRTYTNTELGLSFNYPKSWKVTKVKVRNRTKFDITNPKTWRPASTDNTTRFLLPVEGSKQDGTLEIYSAQFFAETDIWQYSQKDINDQMKRPVLRQWQEEILGVPL